MCVSHSHFEFIVECTHCAAAASASSDLEVQRLRHRVYDEEAKRRQKQQELEEALFELRETKVKWIAAEKFAHQIKRESEAVRRELSKQLEDTKQRLDETEAELKSECDRTMQAEHEVWKFQLGNFACFTYMH